MRLQHLWVSGVAKVIRATHGQPAEWRQHDRPVFPIDEQDYRTYIIKKLKVPHGCENQAPKNFKGVRAISYRPVPQCHARITAKPVVDDPFLRLPDADHQRYFQKIEIEMWAVSGPLTASNDIATRLNGCCIFDIVYNAPSR